VSNPYTSQAISGYNASPPPDDGSVVAANVLKWSNHKDKLADPVKTLAEAINTETINAFGRVFGNTHLLKSANYTVAAADIGKFIEVDASGVTITLLPVVTAGIGFPLIILNTSGGDVTVAADGSETIRTSEAAASTLTLNSGDAIVLTSDAAAWVGVFAQRSSIAKSKSGTTSRVVDTLLDDPDLAGWSIGINQPYSIEGFIPVFQNGGDFRFRFTLTNAAVEEDLHYIARDTGGTEVNDFNTSITATQTLTTLTDNQTYGLNLKGSFLSHATLAATLDFQWGQGTSFSIGTNVIRGAWIKVRKV